MYCQNLQAALNYTVHELVEARRSLITLTTPKGVLDTKRFLAQITEAEPRLMLSVERFCYERLLVGNKEKIRIEVTYTQVMTSFVEIIEDGDDLRQAFLRAIRLHRKAIYVVFKKERRQALDSAADTFFKDPEILEGYLEKYRTHSTRMHDCSYLGVIYDLTYSCSYKEYRRRQTEMAQKVREIAKLARRYGQEDWKRAYGVVCYCVEHWTYERTGTEYTAYSALVQNKAVCMGFSLAMCMIMKELGIPCRYVSGKRQGNGHGWNLIYLKGGWFYIDVTDAVCRKDPLYHWGMVNMDDRIMTTPVNERIQCHCPASYVRDNIRRHS